MTKLPECGICGWDLVNKRVIVMPECPTHGGPPPPYGSDGCRCFYWDDYADDAPADTWGWTVGDTCPLHGKRRDLSTPPDGPECPPGVHSMFDPCPGGCTLPVEDDAVVCTDCGRVRPALNLVHQCHADPPDFVDEYKPVRRRLTADPIRPARGGALPPYDAGKHGDDKIVRLSPGSATCSGCGATYTGGTEAERLIWFMNHKHTTEKGRSGRVLAAVKRFIRRLWAATYTT